MNCIFLPEPSLVAAVILAEPAPRAVMLPVLSTVATDSLLLDQFRDGSVAFAGNRLYCARTVWPAWMDSGFGESSLREATGTVTTTSAEACSMAPSGSCATQVTTARPPSTALRMPLATRTTDSSEEIQEKTARWPFSRFCTTGVSRVEFPFESVTDVSLREREGADSA